MSALVLSMATWLLLWIKTDLDPSALVAGFLVSAALFALAGGVITRRAIWWVTLLVATVEWGILIVTMLPTAGWGCPARLSPCAAPGSVWFGPPVLTAPIVVIVFLGRLAGRRAGWSLGRVGSRA
jgi:hypothetical protein